MKQTAKIISIAVLSSALSLFLFNKLFHKENEVQNRQISPTVYQTSLNSLSTGSLIRPPDFVTTAEKTINAVVHVKNMSVVNESPYSGWRSFFFGDSSPARIGTGSGVLVSPDGYIITNNHVIEDFTEIEVTTNDNKTYIAQLIGTDSATDIAVLKIDAPVVHPYLRFGNSNSTRIGEWVLAVGNPFNLNSTVTAGIISAKSRDLNPRDNKNESYIQTDAAVNVGNSGGALVNINGELIGINTAITSMTGGFVGYSFAVPSNIARKVFEDILEYGNVQRVFMGIQGISLNAYQSEELNIEDTVGFYIKQVEKGFGAEVAGLKAGDIIKSIDGFQINKFADLSGYLSTKRPGDTVNVSYARNNNMLETEVELKKINFVNLLGFRAVEMSKKQLEDYKIKQGVLITNIYDRTLYDRGIEEGFALLKINEKPVGDISVLEKFNPYQVESMLFSDKLGNKVWIQYGR